METQRGGPDKSPIELQIPKQLQIGFPLQVMIWDNFNLHVSRPSTEEEGKANNPKMTWLEWVPFPEQIISSILAQILASPPPDATMLLRFHYAAVSYFQT